MVEAIGAGVTSVKAGDRVSVQPLIMPRVGDYYAERGLFHLSSELALAGLSWPWGGMAEYATLNEYNVQAIPDAMSDEEAALVEPAAVAVYACDRGDVKAGNSVFITGAGPIGQLTLLAARAAGAAQLFLSDINDARLEFAKSVLPDIITINPKRGNAGDVVRSLTEGKVGCDVAIECVGNEHALKACVDAVSQTGSGSPDRFTPARKSPRLVSGDIQGHRYPRVLGISDTLLAARHTSDQFRSSARQEDSDEEDHA